ncbi:putative poly(A) polymerase regulatory small subunit [Diachasmimorpha longicaudata entomopoxvirus]|uniref:Cap-specific mRNA (nucleoside-2'-O-)-methyltransferase n=1 Tax=Diachasmimorpha longicaudata entomopoxvirus TaxID=109981 RepID=Q5GF32_9POXV|nr:putative poly(A) polymerase regulatory small subunit [Diachasmimorpha longicaudata entomopoxvirus]YP_010796914.1 putative poly(A) polymerase regulatory small subunit [Diachasmimorpha longicaudata entomopoxvirus]AAT99852.1 putative poly(A) polymerase regulatory small subunit [Diachasmimorpha longicaudata entomopoxvirus]AKS26458.1 putative poly(A) polymerase regulatory small subunit [Diachasmimorpha longicaudata entomopoxvirus]
MFSSFSKRRPGIPKFYYVSDIQDRSVYNPNLAPVKPFPKQGQLKLLLNEIRFFSESIDIHHDLRKGVNYTVLYIGSSPGLHIPFLIQLYSKYKIKWWFYDPKPACQKLKDMAKKNKNINLIENYFTKDDIKTFKNTRDLIFISDIRSSEDNSEPTTTNLLFDYKLQNEILLELQPLFAHLKFRVPFPDDWVEGTVLQVPDGEEQLQAFAPSSSAEYRIFCTQPLFLSEISTMEQLVSYEEQFSWYNTYQKKENDLVIAAHILNVYFRKEKGETYNLTKDTVMDFIKKKILNKF